MKKMFIILAGLIVFGFGVKTMFIDVRGYEKTTALIADIHDDPGCIRKGHGGVCFEYHIGKEMYTEWIVMHPYSNFSRNGETTIYYDPADPAQIKVRNDFRGMAFLTIGSIVLVASLCHAVNRRMNEVLLAA